MPPHKTDVSAATRPARAVVLGWLRSAPWLAHWDFWLAVILAAFLRLWHIELTQFLQDQVDLATLARAPFVQGALPITGNLSSIGTYHPPLSIYFLTPFFAFGNDPLLAALSIALLNVLAVALTYLFALRYQGRVVAGSAALLFATAPVLINYSRFLWQPNYVPLVTLLAVIALYRGTGRGRPNALLIGAVLLLADILIHPANLLLLPLLLVAFLVAPALPRLRAWLVAALVALALLLPTILFEVLSRGADVSAYLRITRGAETNLMVVRALTGLFGGPSDPAPHIRTLYALLSGAAVLLFALGLVVLTARVAQPIRAEWTTARHEAPGQPFPALLLSLWQRLRAREEWRIYVLLWLWMVVPLLGLLRHTAPVTVHYLLFLVPGVFLIQGYAIAWLLSSLDQLRLPLRASAVASAVVPVTSVLVLLSVALLAAGQAVRWARYPAALADGRFNAYAGYGIPLADLLAANDQLATLQRQHGAIAAYILTPEAPRYREPFNDLFASERADRVTLSGTSCLLLPASEDGPVLITVAQPHTPAADLLATLPNATRIAELSPRGAAPFPVYRVQAGAPPLPGEHPTPPVIFTDDAGHGLHLESIAQSSPNLIRLRWRVLHAAPPEPTAPLDTQSHYRIALSTDTASSSDPSIVARTDCLPTRLHAGQTLLTWMTLPSPPPPNTPLYLQVQHNTVHPEIITLGPARFITGRPGDSPLLPLPHATNCTVNLLPNIMLDCS